ncbi:MAG: hypothetical protein FJ295_17430 [Planctomycetes bacterium]|nr:hypothetical protein [Planctomycetota bacterium]
MNRTVLWGSVAGLALFWFAGVRQLPGQPPRPGEGEKATIFRPAPRDLTLALQRARKAIAEEHYSDAVAELGRMLNELEAGTTPADVAPQDFFLAAKTEAGTYTSLKTEAQQLLGSMPAKGREWYELQFGSQAKAQLEMAVSRRDPNELAATSRRFFHTRAGYEATLLLGRYHLDQGRPLAAAICFKRLLDSPAARDFEPELSVLLSASWYFAHRDDKALQTLSGNGVSGGGVARRDLRIGGDSLLQMPQNDPLAWLRKTLGVPPRTLLATGSEWTMFRGNATRTAASVGDLPLRTPCWRVPTANDLAEEKLLEATQRQFLSQGVAAIPALQPLAVDGMILMRATDRMLAIHAETGKRVWPFPWDEGGREDQGAFRDAQRTNNPVMRQRELSQRIWEDNPYGQISSDGAFIFLLEELGFAAAGNVNNFGGGIMVQNNGIPQRNRNQERRTNQLVAVELKSEGKIQWRVGDADGLDERQLAGAFFLGAPLPAMGQLFALAEFGGEIRLVVLNARTGRLEWQQQLAHLDNRTIDRDAMRRLMGASPSFADGVLVCPTAAGAVVAVDVATRTLLWGYQYGTSAQEFRPGWRNAIAIPSRNYGARWVDATVTLAEGHAILTPAESDELYCLDLLTGKLAWPAMRRDDHLFVGGVRNGKILLVGKNKLTAIDLATGKPSWSKATELPEGAIVSGRGFVKDGSYFVPTTAAQIVQIDIEHGSIVQQVATEGVLGNLIGYRDLVIAHGPNSLAAYYSIPALRTNVATRLQQQPQDAWAVARLAELQLHDGQRKEGLATLRQAYELDHDDDAIRMLLFQTQLNLLNEDYAANRHLATEIEPLIDQPWQRVAYLRSTANGLRRMGLHAEAFDAFLKLALFDGDSEAEMTPALPREQVSRNLSVRHDRWVYARLAALYNEASAADRATMDTTIGAQWTFARDSSSEKVLRRFVSNFGFHPMGDRARLALARKLIETEELLEAEQLLARLDSDDNRSRAAPGNGSGAPETPRRTVDRELRAAARWELAGIYLRVQYFDLARQLLDRLRDDYADVEILPGKSALQCCQELMLSDFGERMASHRWSNGRTELLDGPEVAGRYQNFNFNPSVSIVSAAGPTTSGLHIVTDMARSNVLIVRDGQGRELVQASIARGDMRGISVFSAVSINGARIHGHLAVAQVNAELFAVNCLRGTRRSADAQQLWRDDLAQLGELEAVGLRTQTRQFVNPWDDARILLTDSSGRFLGQAGPLTAHGLIYQRGRDLQCVDPITKELLWARNDIEQGADLFGDDELLFVAPQNSDEALVFSTLDGSELGRRKFVNSQGRWATRGRNALIWSQADGRLKLRLFDVWTGNDLLTRDCPNGSKACRIQNEELAVLQPEGQLIIASLDTGELRVSTTVEPCLNLLQLRVIRNADQYLVIANQQHANPKPNVQPIAQQSATLFLQRAAVYSFDRVTGKSQWQVPAMIEQHALTLDQPADLPVLVFFQVTRAPTQQTSLICIDKRDGRLLAQWPELPGQLPSLEIEGDPATQMVTIWTPLKAFKVHFTDEPVAPEPPAQTGSASTVGYLRGTGLLGSIARLGKNLIGEGDEAGEKNGDPFADP